jgi:hypothetical protein
MGTVGDYLCVWGERRRLGEGTWLLDFIYLYETEQSNLLQ